MMEDLFTTEPGLSSTPLAALLRPRTLEDFVGQEHLLGPQSPLRQMMANDHLASMIVYGPPGCGKTTLAHLIAQSTKALFIQLNAVSATIQDIRDAAHKARYARDYDKKRTVLFIDEVHRFNKAQQDVLMPLVEEGLFVFIGATTENPFFAVNAALISRAHVLAFRPLSLDNIKNVVRKALAHPHAYCGHVRMDDAVLAAIARHADGDARRALNLLEFLVKTTAVNAQGLVVIAMDDLKRCPQVKPIVYDGTGDDHYDTISAFIKSMRGSDAQATVYWLAKMLYAGEDINFIARRIAICAAEDVGLADPQAIVVAQAAWDMARQVGMPEARIPLAQAAVYVATAPKSNSAYVAIDAALAHVKAQPLAAVPQHLRDASYPGAKELGHGKGYIYPHDHPGHHVSQEYLSLKDVFYQPSNQGYEQQIAQRMTQWTKPK